MKVERIVTKYFEQNCYLVIKDQFVLIVDPGSYFEKINSFIKVNNLVPQGILITHYHFDHIGALKELKKAYNIPVVDIKNKIKLEHFDFDVIETKGHSSDSVSFYFKNEKIIFTGDFLFKGDIGRYDFEDSREDEMKKSIKLIKTFDKDILVYPGHGESTTINDELLYNEYLR